MSRLTELIERVAAADPDLARELGAEVRVLSERREFGLNFEHHIPESVELPGRPIRTEEDDNRVLVHACELLTPCHTALVTGFNPVPPIRTSRPCGNP